MSRVYFWRYDGKELKRRHHDFPALTDSTKGDNVTIAKERYLTIATRPGMLLAAALLTKYILQARQIGKHRTFEMILV